MSSYNLTINGRKHRVTVNSDWTQTYDPPLENAAEDSAVNQQKFQDMLDSGKTPGCSTETRWWAGRTGMADSFHGDEKYLQFVTDNLKRQGVDVNPRGVYLQSLVRPGFEGGDPQAYISPSDGLSKVRKVVESRGLACEGPGIKVKSTPQDRDAFADAKPLANDIVNRIAGEYRKNPEFAAMPENELKRVVIENHGAKN